MRHLGGKLPPTQPPSDSGTDTPAPFSLRLTFEERAALEQAAGDMPLGAYIRDQVLRDGTARKRRRYKRPVKDHQVLGQLLGALGEALLANNLNQLANPPIPAPCRSPRKPRKRSGKPAPKSTRCEAS
jgi:hypothetical protein